MNSSDLPSLGGIVGGCDQTFHEEERQMTSMVTKKILAIELKRERVREREEIEREKE